MKAYESIILTSHSPQRRQRADHQLFTTMPRDAERRVKPRAMPRSSHDASSPSHTAAPGRDDAGRVPTRNQMIHQVADAEAAPKAATESAAALSEETAPEDSWTLGDLDAWTPPTTSSSS